MGKIISKSWVSGLRIVFRLQLRLIDSHKFLSFAGFFTEAVVSDPIKPGRKPRFAAETAEVFVGAQKCLLREIVRERDIGADELAEQTPDARLMIPHQLRKGVVVVIEKNARDEVCIGERHVGRLRQRRNFVFTAFQFPNEQVTGADQKRDNAQTPRAAFPVVHRPEEDH